VEWSAVEGRMCASSKRQGPVAYMTEKEKLYGELLFLQANLSFSKSKLCTMIFFVAKFTIFLIKKNSQAKWSRQLFGIFSMNLFMKSPRFLEDLCMFLAFFFF
jgi:hypothetical protein